MSNLSSNVISGLVIDFTPNTLQILRASKLCLVLCLGVFDQTVFMKHRAGSATDLP